MLELHRRKVDRYMERLRPGCGLTTRLAQSPFSHLHDEAAVLGKRNKDTWWDHLACGMFPSHQRFESAHLPVNSCLRLIMQHQLVEFDCRPEFVLQLSL